MKKLFVAAGIAIVSIGALNSCKDKPGVAQSKTIKYTVTVSGLAGDDRVLVQMSGGTPDNQPTIWKINGALQNNKTHLVLDQAVFAGGTPVIVESTVPLIAILLHISGTNESGTTPYTVRVEPVAGGNPEPVINVNIATNFVQSYQF